VDAVLIAKSEVIAAVAIETPDNAVLAHPILRCDEVQRSGSALVAAHAPLDIITPSHKRLIGPPDLVGGPTALTHEGLITAESDVPADLRVVWGARVETERGHRLEAIAVQLSAAMAELRDDSGLPYDTHPHHRAAQHRLLEIRVEGLSIETDPNHTTSREVMTRGSSWPATKTSSP